MLTFDNGFSTQSVFGSDKVLQLSRNAMEKK